MKNIKYIKGDATRPVGEGKLVIVHVCNDIGGWGKGFVLALSNRWKAPEISYRNWFKSQEKFGLGEVQFVQVEENVWVANLIGQHKINKDENGFPPIRYEAIDVGLNTIGGFASELKASIHMPRIGCGLAGGKWEEIEPLIIKNILEENVAVTVYDF